MKRKNKERKKEEDEEKEERMPTEMLGPQRITSTVLTPS